MISLKNFKDGSFSEFEIVNEGISSEVGIFRDSLTARNYTEGAPEDALIMIAIVTRADGDDVEAIYSTTKEELGEYIKFLQGVFERSV